MQMSVLNTARGYLKGAISYIIHALPLTIGTFSVQE